MLPGTVDGKPDTYVVTGDIDAMWLRDSSAQVWPYVPLAKEDAELRELLEGSDPAAGADDSARSLCECVHARREAAAAELGGARQDGASRGRGRAQVGDGFAVLSAAAGAWILEGDGDTRPFDAEWKEAAWTIVRTFRDAAAQRGPGALLIRARSAVPYDTVPLGGFGNPARPVGMIFSMFRPSDDACIYPLFVPANLFAVVSLRKLAEMAAHVLDDAKLAAEAAALAMEVERALEIHGKTHHEKFGEIWAYEVDGYGNALMMDDANAPGLVSMAYLGCCERGRSALPSDAGVCAERLESIFLPWQGGRGRGRAARGTEHDLADGDHVPGADRDRRCGDTAVPALVAGHDGGDRVHA